MKIFKVCSLLLAVSITPCCKTNNKNNDSVSSTSKEQKKVLVQEERELTEAERFNADLASCLVDCLKKAEEEGQPIDFATVGCCNDCGSSWDSLRNRCKLANTKEQ